MNHPNLSDAINSRDARHKEVVEALIAAIPEAQLGNWHGAIQSPKYRLEVSWQSKIWERNPNFRVVGDTVGYRWGRDRKPYFLTQTVEDAVAKLPALLAKIDALREASERTEANYRSAEVRKVERCKAMLDALVAAGFPATAHLDSSGVMCQTPYGELSVHNSGGIWTGELRLGACTTESVLEFLQAISEPICKT